MMLEVFTGSQIIFADWTANRWTRGHASNTLHREKTIALKALGTGL